MKLKLDLREQLGLVAGLVAFTLVVMLLIYIPSGPMEEYTRSQKNLRQLRNELRLTRLMKLEEQERLRSREKLMEQLAARPSGFNFFSFVNSVLAHSDLTERAQLENYRRPGGSAKQPMVELMLERVSLEELINFLHKLYASENLVVLYKLDHIEPANDERGLNCRMVLATIKL